MGNSAMREGKTCKTGNICILFCKLLWHSSKLFRAVFNIFVQTRHIKEYFEPKGVGKEPEERKLITTETVNIYLQHLLSQGVIPKHNIDNQG